MIRRALIWVIAFAIVIPVSAFVITLFTVANAFVVSTTWNWLIVPIFNMRTLTPGQAFAVSVALSAFRDYRPNHTVTTKEQDKKGLFMVVARYPILIGMAWIASHFV